MRNRTKLFQEAWWDMNNEVISVLAPIDRIKIMRFGFVNIKFLCALLMIAITSCDILFVNIHARYEAQINDYSKLEEIENRMDVIAGHWNLEIVKKLRGMKRRPPKGYPRLDIELHIKEDMSTKEPILLLSNRGVGYRLKLTTIDQWNILVSDLERLTQDVLRELGEIGFEFYPVGVIYYIDESPQCDSSPNPGRLEC